MTHSKKLRNKINPEARMYGCNYSSRVLASARFDDAALRRSADAVKFSTFRSVTSEAPIRKFSRAKVGAAFPGSTPTRHGATKLRATFQPASLPVSRKAATTYPARSRSPENRAASPGFTPRETIRASALLCSPSAICIRRESTT